MRNKEEDLVNKVDAAIYMSAWKLWFKFLLQN